MKDKLLSRFILWAFIEATAYMVMVAGMVIRGMTGNEAVVKYTGWLHGLIFIIYIVYLIRLAKRDDWQMKYIVLAFLLAFVPGGTYWIEAKYSKAYQNGRCELSDAAI